MGLCKCDRKKVTNLFCFEHRVNVCEFCLTANHPTCVVKSYLHWLKDSDYSSQCSLCSKELNGTSPDECVRLMCLDVFHWQCLDRYASQLPPTTAPAGYECPSCAQSIIPLANQGGPVAEALRQKLSFAKWIKPNLQERYSSTRTKAVPYKAHKPLEFNDGKLLDAALDTFAKQFLHDHEMVTSPPVSSPRPDDTVVPMDLPVTASELTSRPEFRGSPPDTQVPAKEIYSKPRNFLINYEEDKYSRHPYPPSKTTTNALGSMGRISSAALRIFLRYRLFCIFGFIILLFSASMVIANIASEPAPSDEAMMPARLKVPANV